MELYYTDKKNIFSTYLRIIGSEAHHINRVMRHKIGDMIYVTDGIGNEYQTMINKMDKRMVEASVLNRNRNARETTVKITLAQSIIKGNHLDVVIEKATELGVAEIIPIITERTIASVSEKKAERYKKLILAAMKSSTRTLLPSLVKPMIFKNLLQQFKDSDLVVLAYEDEKNTRLPDVISNNMIKNVLLIIGPEGGFTEAEISEAKTCGAKCITIGARRLRAETASIAALSILLYQLKEM
jgi:16S rRNA (uracil1498-N3)-methyltransferase